MLSLLSCQSHGCIGGLLGSFCLHTSLLEIVDAITRFLYQFQVLLEDEHEIDWVMSIFVFYSDQELGG